MTAVAPFDPQAARRGLALLQMQARAADPQSQPGWVHRRVQQLEFLDTRAVRWRVSVDFVVPQGAPKVRLGDKNFYLVPITSLAKIDLVAFSLRDELGAAVWMPTSTETTTCLASALVYWAAQDAGCAVTELPPVLAADIWRVVQERPAQLAARMPVLLLTADLIDARMRHELAAEGGSRREIGAASRALDAASAALEGVAAEVRQLAEKLMASANFRSQIEELAQNFIVHVGTNSPPGSRRIIKLAYESEIRFARPRGRFHRLWQSLGWRCWQVDVRIGGRGGSPHLEVAAPPGIDVVGITADPVEVIYGRRAGGLDRRSGRRRSPPPPARAVPPARPALPILPAGVRAWLGRVGAGLRSLVSAKWWRGQIFWSPSATFAVSGYAPHVHINPPGGSLLRYRCAIFIRVSRPGWLTGSWLVAVVIGVVVVVGRFSLPTLFSQGQSGEAGTAATLLLALLGVFATMLLRPGEHPLASRLLIVARLLILIQAAVVLVAVGNLVLHQAAHRMPIDLWTWLAAVAGGATVLFTVSWLLPVAWRPHRGS